MTPAAAVLLQAASSSAAHLEEVREVAAAAQLLHDVRVPRVLWQHQRQGSASYASAGVHSGTTAAWHGCVVGWVSGTPMTAAATTTRPHLKRVDRLHGVAAVPQLLADGNLQAGQGRRGRWGRQRR